MQFGVIAVILWYMDEHPQKNSKTEWGSSEAPSQRMFLI